MPVTVTFERVITEDWKLSDGFVIPANTTIGVPTQAISMDPEIYEEPEKFDGFRFTKLRENPAIGGKANYASSNPVSMNFGFGRHACPGYVIDSSVVSRVAVRYRYAND